MIIFLDFDGVLHPDSAYLVNGRPVLRGDGELFMWTFLLSDLLAACPNVRIVLSTSWVRLLSFTRARSYLPEALQKRVIGATWHSRIEDYQRWDSASRYQQIRRYVNRAGLKNWIAIDDDGEGWSPADADRLIQTDGERGISDPAILLQIADKLKKLKAAQEC